MPEGDHDPEIKAQTSCPHELCHGLDCAFSNAAFANVVPIQANALPLSKSNDLNRRHHGGLRHSFATLRALFHQASGREAESDEKRKSRAHATPHLPQENRPSASRVRRNPGISGRSICKNADPKGGAGLCFRRSREINGPLPPALSGWRPSGFGDSRESRSSIGRTWPRVPGLERFGWSRGDASVHHSVPRVDLVNSIRQRFAGEGSGRFEYFQQGLDDQSRLA